MSGFQAVPLISDQHAIRTTPFESQTGPSQSLPTSIPQRGSGPAGVNQFGSSGVDTALADDELTPDEIQELQAAAEQGDSEAASLLEQLGLVGGAMAAGGAAGAGVYGLKQAMMNRYQGSDTLPDGSSKFVNGADIPRTAGMYYPGEMTNIVPSGEAGEYIRPQPAQIGQEQRAALPAPAKQIADQRNERFNQPAPQEQKQIPDMRAKAGNTLRKAAKAVRGKR
jgi:hypothetical protein